MKQPKLTKVLLATSLTLTFAMNTFATSAHAELVNEQVESDVITPQPSSDEDVVILKKKPVAKRAALKQRTLPQEPISAMEAVEATPVALQEMPMAQPAPRAVVASPAASASATATATATSQATSAAPAKQSMGSTLDQGVNNKMDEVRGQFENALVRTLDRIKITVDDGAGANASATATATATAVAAPAPAPVPVQVVAEPVVPPPPPANYMRVDNERDADDREEKVKEEKKEERSFVSRFRLSPEIGVTSIGSDYYDIKSAFSVGIKAEMDVAENFSVLAGYDYSKFEIGLGTQNPLYGAGANYGVTGNRLKYNQNLFTLGGRFYITPSESVFRPFVGAGFGYAKSYINYGSNNFYGSGGYNNGYYGYNNGVTDYELNQWIGYVEAGADIKISSNVSIGGAFKYNTILSSNQNSNLNNYGFYGSNYGGGITQDQAAAGGTLADQGFWSLMGAVKVGF